MPVHAATVVSTMSRRHRRLDRWLYISFGLFLILLSVAGFGPSIVDQSKRNAPLTPLVIAHGAAMIVVGVLTIVEGAQRGYDLSGDGARAFTPLGSPRLTPEESAPFLLFPLAAFVSFGVLVAAGLWYRRRPEIHKRLMLFALFPLVGDLKTSAS